MAETSIAKWKCTPYAGQNIFEADAPLPYALRCWENEAHRGYAVVDNWCTRNCKSHTDIEKWDGWSDGLSGYYQHTYDDGTISSKYTNEAYNCTGYAPQNRESINLDDCSANTIATVAQINAIRSAIENEINNRQKNPTYQANKQSRITIQNSIENNINSSELPDLPNSPNNSPANTNILSNMLMYKSLLSTLEEYIKLADKEKSINLSGNGPSTETIDFADTNIIRVADENKLTAIYAATYQDCICYTDCNGYAVCWCYSNCNHY